MQCINLESTSLRFKKHMGYSDSIAGRPPITRVYCRQRARSTGTNLIPSGLELVQGGPSSKAKSVLEGAHIEEAFLVLSPYADHYDSYLSKHGGSSNAYTEPEHTCYYFDVKREFLMGALKRFSQFFISPLVKVEAMEREVLAVDSGNRKSLVDAMERGVDLREQILRIYRENYHGGVMKLVVIGGEPLDTLQDWVLELFSNVKEGQPVKTKIHTEAPIWKSNSLYRLEAVKDIHSLDLTWTMPCLHKEYLQKPQDYLAHLLGHGKHFLA
ncbi:hypothetical protein Syun_017007 [Stephania yunnanensis]|uniref:Peptidase M16 C-terminal domain-containing protein n=1 Tax=Stephania yunnanensis TaxID=152371 RepID=A0AAP0J724_9MAGN